MATVRNGKTYMIDGFEVEGVDPAPWELRLTWKNGKTTVWPARTRHGAVAAQRHISLRTDLMQRIEVVGDDTAHTLWDESWPRARWGDLLDFPAEIGPDIMKAMMWDIERSWK